MVRGVKLGYLTMARLLCRKRKKSRDLRSEILDTVILITCEEDAFEASG